MPPDSGILKGFFTVPIKYGQKNFHALKNIVYFLIKVCMGKISTPLFQTQLKTSMNYVILLQ